jgi:hypothetical protein
MFLPIVGNFSSRYIRENPSHPCIPCATFSREARLVIGNLEASIKNQMAGARSNLILHHYLANTLTGTPATSVPTQSALEKMRSIFFPKERVQVPRRYHSATMCVSAKLLTTIQQNTGYYT